MNSSAPADLAVAFRSFRRRIADATTDETEPDAADKAASAVDASIVAAAQLLGSPSTPDGVAAAISDRRSSSWTDDELAALQAHADAAARAIRTLQSSTGR